MTQLSLTLPALRLIGFRCAKWKWLAVASTIISNVTKSAHGG